MRKCTSSQIYHWLLPIIDYPWIDEIDSEKYPYKAGLVLLDENARIRGFSAAIHSKQKIDGYDRIVVNPSTTVIDKECNFYYFGMSKAMFKHADVVFDLSPNEPARRISKDMLKCIIIDNPVYLFRPNYVWHNTFSVDEHITNEKVRRIVIDHKNTELKYARISNHTEETYVFYKIIRRIKSLPIKVLCVLDISNPEMFRNNFNECASLLSRKKHCLIMLDSRYADQYQLPKLHITKQKYRALFNPSGNTYYTFLYSESVLLQNEMI